ncbi:glycosyltransferase family 4 protein [Planococcus sp. CPCC 101016]|uniref:glycosyltransferase family 4 protein n=1 Tax=Planococcus sp. CPCC 101016 TaxID=2599617 RepID=UPI0021BDEA39|nr:glycosyltransferase family 4 protein [Planococcus sp. CPCC 101016]
MLHVNSYFNGSLFYKNLYEKQIQKKMDIEVFVPIAKNDKENISNHGKYITVSPNFKKIDRFFYHIKHYKIHKNLQKKYDVENFSLIHAHSLFSNGYIAMKMKKKYSLPYIVAVRNTDVNIFFKKVIYLRKTGVSILLHAQKIIFLSEAYREVVIEKYIPELKKEEVRKKSVVIPNGIDDFWINNLGSNRSLEKNFNLKLLYVGEINENKNITSTLQAIELLKQKGFSIEFTIVGKITDENIYKKITEKSYVNYITPLKKEELLHVYRSHDIFIMPSLKETFGLVYAEAMSQGLPIIYTEEQGFDRQFENGFIGYSVNPLDSKNIAEKVLEIIDKYNYLSINCVSSIDKFNWSNIEGTYNEIYTSVVSEKEDINE